ncbi:CoA pyrophosphatase, partial [Pelomonas sp. HMWF004]
DGLHLLLTRRTAHLRSHAGQISFPGGRVEPEDAGPVATALRETQEEIGLAADCIEVIGQLPVYSTVTAFQVTPVVGLVRPGFTLALDAFEVAEAFEVPLAFLMNPAHHQHHCFEFEGMERRFLSMPWQGEGGEYFIWGATAAMLRNLYQLLSAA